MYGSKVIWLRCFSIGWKLRTAHIIRLGKIGCPRNVTIRVISWAGFFSSSSKKTTSSRLQFISQLMFKFFHLRNCGRSTFVQCSEKRIEFESRTYISSSGRNILWYVVVRLFIGVSTPITRQSSETDKGILYRAENETLSKKCFVMTSLEVLSSYFFNHMSIFLVVMALKWVFRNYFPSFYFDYCCPGRKKSKRGAFILTSKRKRRILSKQYNDSMMGSCHLIRRNQRDRNLHCNDV